LLGDLNPERVCRFRQRSQLFCSCLSGATVQTDPIPRRTTLWCETKISAGDPATRARAVGACSPPRTNSCMKRRAAAGPFQQLGKQLLYVLRSAMKYSTRRQNKALGLIMYSEQQAIYYALRPPTVACRRWKDSSPHLSRPAQKSDKNKASERPPYRCKQTRSRSPSTEFG
jgi:hypothetical protein